jgi:Tfp pilus assembly protein PilF
VQAGLGWRTLRWALGDLQLANWFPLTLLSHALDVQLYGMDPAGHHFTSLLLHALNVTLLYLLLARATGSPGRSLLVAALFAVHPLNVESVAWVAERKNVLSTLLLLLSLAAWGGYVQKPGVARYLLVAALFALGLAAKPMLVTLPCALLLLDFWPLGRIRGWSRSGALRGVAQLPPSRLVLEKLPLFALTGASIYLTLAAQRAARAVASLHEFPFLVRLENAVVAYATYVWQAFWPTRLTHLYPHPGDGLAGWQVATALALLAAVSALVWRERRERPQLLAGWLWFLGTLVPVIGLVQVGEQAMADRYAYVPLIGVFVMAVWAAAELAGRRGLGIRLRAGAAVLVLALLSLSSHRQIAHWQNNLDLWLHALDVTADNHIAEESAAFALEEAGRLEEALTHYRNAVWIRPDDPVLRINLGSAFARSGSYAEAIPEYEAALGNAETPEMRAIALAEIGTVHRKLGDPAKALEHYQQALRLEPRLPTALRGMQALRETAR